MDRDYTSGTKRSRDFIADVVLELNRDEGIRLPPQSTIRKCWELRGERRSRGFALQRTMGGHGEE
jgi:hypothetical protein